MENLFYIIPEKGAYYNMIILESGEIATLGADAVIKIIALMKDSTPVAITHSSEETAEEPPPPEKPAGAEEEKPLDTPRRQELMTKVREAITHDAQVKERLIGIAKNKFGKNRLSKLTEEELEEVAANA